MIDYLIKPYVPLAYARDLSKIGPPLTPLEVHQKRLMMQGLTPLNAEEIARIYPDKAGEIMPYDG